MEPQATRREGYRSTRSVQGAVVTAPALPSVRNGLGSLSLNFYLGLSLRSPRETPNHPFPTYILGPGQSSLIYSRLALKTMLLLLLFFLNHAYLPMPLLLFQSIIVYLGESLIF